MTFSDANNSVADDKVHVRPACSEDVDAIIALARRGFGPEWSAEKWKRLLEYSKAGSQPNLGFVLEHKDQLVGFLGTIYSERQLEQRVERFCNFTGWYVDPQFRHSSLKLLIAALAQRGYTFTNLTPAERTIPILQKLNFIPLETHKLLCARWLYRTLVAKKMAVPPRNFPWYHARGIFEMLLEIPIVKGLELMQRRGIGPVGGRGSILLAGIELVRAKLSERDQQLLDDHRQCAHFLIEEPQSYSYIITLRRKMRFARRSVTDFVVSDILHFSNYEVALRRWEPLCQMICAHDRSLAVMADERWFHQQCPEGLRIPYQTYFLSRSGVKAFQIDSLYTELPLLGHVFTATFPRHA
jgi:hypothetical protein